MTPTFQPAYRNTFTNMNDNEFRNLDPKISIRNFSKSTKGTTRYASPQYNQNINNNGTDQLSNYNAYINYVNKDKNNYLKKQ
jgi:hypothetical protein